MFMSRKLPVSAFSLLFRVLVIAIFLIGLLPIPALATVNGTVAGQVTDSSTSNPVSSVSISVFASGSQTPSWFGNSDSSGNYTIEVPAGNNYLISAFKEGYVTGHISGKNVTDNTTTVVNFSLAPGGIIQGTVTDNATNPIQNANVQAYLPASPETFYNSMPTDASGHFSLTVPPGEGYTIEAGKQDVGEADQTGISAVISSPTTVDLTLLIPQQQDSTPPADITDLATAGTTSNSVNLTWTAPGDDGTVGTANQYDIRYATSIINDNSKFESAAQAPNITSPQSGGDTETFTVTSLSANTTYFFSIKTKDDMNIWSGLSNPASANTSPPPLTPYFTINHSQGMSSFMLAAGDNITETINITSVNDFEGTVNLHFGGPPGIENFSTVSPMQITLTANQTQQITLNIGTGPSMPSGTYQCGMGGQTSAYGGQEKGFFLTVIIGVPGQPMLSASPPVIAAGGQVNFFASQFPASGNITLKWDSGPNAGVTIAEGQVSGDSTWNVQVTIPAETPGGNFAIKALAGQAGAVCHITVTAGSDPDYLLSASPQFVSITTGQSANITIYVSSINGFNSAVSLMAGTAPGVTSSLSVTSVTPASEDTASVVLTINVAEWASPNVYQLNIDGSCTDPSINKVTNINLDIQPPAEWGPGISLSQSYAQAGDTITVSGSNFPPSCNGANVTIMEAFSGNTLQTIPATIAVSNGSFTGTFSVPSQIPSGNYRIKAIVQSTGDFAERDFQILGTGETFSLGVSPQSTTVATEEGQNSSSVSVNIYSMGGSNSTVNLALEGVPNWLTYQFGNLPVNTAAAGANAISVPAGGSASRNLNLTASMSAPPGNYSITVKAWVTEGAEQRVSLELTVQPPAGFGMTEFNLSPTFGQVNQLVNFSGSDFLGCTPSQVTELRFGPVDLLTSDNMSTIIVPTSGDSEGRLSGTFRVPSTLGPGTYFVDIMVGWPSENMTPTNKFSSKSFTITGGTDTFVIQASPSSLWVEQGNQISTMIRVQAVGSTSPTVVFSVEGCPSDITASFTSDNVTAPPGSIASTDLNLNISEWMPTGHHSFTIKGQRAGSEEVNRIPIDIYIAPPEGYDMASIYLNPTVGSAGTWITISGSGFSENTSLANLYFGPPNVQNDQIANGTLPAINTDGSGAFSAVFQVPTGLTPGTYPIEAVVGTYPNDRRAMAYFTFVSDQATFNINVSPMMIQTAPGAPVGTTVNVQSFGGSSANVTLSIEGPPTIEWRFDGGAWQTSANVSPSIGSTLMSSLEIQPKASTSMGHFSLAVKAVSGNTTEIRNLELDVGASADYDMPIFSLNPNTGTAGTNVSFSGSNFPPSANVTRITFGSADITLAQTITTSPQRTFSGAFTVPATVGGQPLAPGTYPVRVFVGEVQADAMFNVYGGDDTFILTLSPNFLQGEPGSLPETSGILKALGGAAPTVKVAVKGLPPGVITEWNGINQPIFSISAPPGGQNSFRLMLVLPGMIPMGQYPATLEGWVDTNQNNTWDSDEKITRVNLELSIMPPQGYSMGMLSLSPTYGQVGDMVTFSGSGFSGNTTVTSLTFVETDVLTANITTALDGSFSGVFTVPDTAYGNPTGPGRYPVDVIVGTYPDDRMGGFDFEVVSTDQKFNVSASPGWLARPAGDTASVSLSVRSLVTNPPSPTVILQVEGLPYGITASFTSANVTPPIGGMEGRELQLNISNSCPSGNYPISIRAYNAANPAEEIWTDFTLEVTPSSGFMDMGMAMVTLSQNYGSVGEQITVSGYGFPSNQNLSYIELGRDDVTPTSVNITTDNTGAFSAVITVPPIPPGTHPVVVNVQETVRMTPFNIMSVDDAFSLKVSPNWMEPIPAGDPNGRQIAITITALPGKTPIVTLSTEGLFAAYGTITQNWNPVSRTVNVTNAGGSATAMLTLIASENLPPGPYPFNIIAIDENQNRRDFFMEFQVGPPAGFMDTDWMAQEGVYFPDIFLSPNSGPAGTQISYTGTNLPAGANVTSINFAGYSIPLPSGGLTADSSGGFSGSFIVDEAWGLAPGGMYWVDFHLETDTWSQNIGNDFNLMRGDAAFSLEANPNWIPPIPPDSYGQTIIKLKALSYNSVNVTLAVMEEMNGWGIPGGAQAHWNTTDGPATTNATVPSGSQTSKTFYLKGANPGYYMITIVGWIDSNGNQILDKHIPSEADSEFCIPLDFDVEPPADYKSWDMDTMMDDMGMTNDDMYLFYFPEIVLNPNVGQAGTKVNINATDFPANAAVSHLRFAGMDLPVPTGTSSDSNGDFSLVFNVPQTIWSAPIGSGWYDIEVEAYADGQPPVFIMKPFQVTTSDTAFTLRADPDWLPPIPSDSSVSTLIRVRSTGTAANVTLSVDKIPPGINTSFSSNSVNVTPGGSGTTTLSLTPTSIPSGHYCAEIKGTAIINSIEKIFYTHIEFDVEPPHSFMDWDRDTMMYDMDMADDDMYLFYFPEIVLNPNMSQAGKKVTISATDFPAGANVTRLRFAGMNLPVPAGTAANENGGFTLVFNIPKTIWNAPIGPGWYDVEVEAQNPNEPPVFIMKPFQVTTGDTAFTLRAEPDWLPPIPPDGSTTTIRVQSTSTAANVTLSVDKIPPGINTSFSSNSVNVTPGDSGTSTLSLTPTSIPSGHYCAEIKGTATISGVVKTFYTHIEFDVEPPHSFMDWDRDTMMYDMGMADDDMYLFYFPEIVLNPNVGQAGKKVTISATDFPAGANVTSLRFAGMNLPVPAGTAANEYGDFPLVFNVPKTIWSANITSGWYDVEVEAQKPNEPPVFIMKPFQVTTGDTAFTLRAEPDWLPPIPPDGSTTTIRVKSTGTAANVTLSVDKIPPGINTSFSLTQVNLQPGDSGTSTLTLTPTNIPPGHYGAEIKGTAIINSIEKILYTHIEFDVEPAMMFMDTTWMEQQGIWFPEITLNPMAGPVKTKVTIQATDFPVGAAVTHLRFAGRELPIPDNAEADSNGNLTLVFNVPSNYGVGQYMVEVEAQKEDMQYPVFIAKPFFVEDSGVTFKLNVVPGFIPGVEQGNSGNTTIFVESAGQAVTVQLYVDGLPQGVTGTFDSDTITVPPGISSSTKLNITTWASTPPGHYPLTIRGVIGNEERMVPFGFGVTPPAAMQVPEFTLDPDYAPAGYADKKYKVTFSGTGFPASQRVTSLEFGSQTVAIPGDLSTDALGNFNGVFQMPTGLAPGTYDVRVAVETLAGGHIYDSRPFSIRSAEAKFILKPSPPYLPPVVQGGQGTTIVNVQSVGTTAANVTLSIDGLAPGITATFTPSNIAAVSPGGSDRATLTINVSSSTPPGPYPLSIRGFSGNETVAVPLGFGVMPDIGAGEGHATITINPAQARPGEHIGISGAGFTSGNTITLTAAPPGAPQAIDITPGTLTVQTDGTWATEITIPEAGQVPPGSYIIKASDGLMASKRPFSIVPATTADFFLNASPQFIEVVRGQSGNTSMTLSSKNGFRERVVFGVGHLIPGVTATFKNATGTTISKFAGIPGGIREIIAPIEQTPIPGEDMTITVVLDVDADTSLGPYDIGLEAGSGTVYRTIPLGFMVTSTGANINISPQSGSADTDITISGSGFTAGETLTVKFAGNSITTVPGTITAAQDGTFTAVITAPSMNAGIYPVSVTGDTSGITIDRPFSLKPTAVNSFVLYASPMKVDIPKGGSGTITAKIEPLGGFQSAVTLTLSGLNAISGATASLSPSATITPSIGTPTTATLTLNVPAGATTGKYSLVITGTSGAIVQTRTVTLNVVPPADTPDFRISLAPNTVPVSPSSSGNTTVTVSAINDFAGTVNLAVTMASANATWPDSVSYTAGSVTPSTNTGLGKQAVTFTTSADALPGTWTFRITGTSGALSHSTDVMVICTPSGTTITEYASPRLDPTTITSSTPMDMQPPWGDKITINGIINDGAEASIITPAKVDVAPDTLATLPEGSSDMLGRVTNVESSSPVDGVEWDIGFPFEPELLTAAGLDEENLKVAYLNPDTGAWTEVTTTIDTTNKIAYASPSHFSSWTLIATPEPPESEVVTEYPSTGGGGGGGSGVTSLAEYVTSGGRFTADATAESVDGRVEIIIYKDTIGMNKAGQRLYSISIKDSATPSPAPVDTRFVSSTYDIGPGGAMFDPPISLVFTYLDSMVPAGVSEENLVMATWQDTKWVALEGNIVDPINNTITVPVSHFSIYTVIARTAAADFEVTELSLAPAEIHPDESTTVNAVITNNGDLSGSHEVTLLVNDSVTATEEINLAGHTSQEISFTLKPDKAGTYTINIFGITATLVVTEAPAEQEAEITPVPAEAESEQPEETPAPAEIQPLPSEEPEAPADIAPVVPEVSAPETGAAQITQFKDWYIFLYVLAAGVVIIGLVYWRTHARRKAS